MKYYPLRKKESAKVKNVVCLKLGEIVCNYVKEAKKVSVLELDDITIVLINDYPAFITDKNYSELIPTLFLIKRLGPKNFKHVKVDEGAVPHILNGADVMIPGITDFSEFSEGDTLIVMGPKDIILAVGKAIIKSAELQKRKKGKAIKTIHYAGDKIWKALLPQARKVLPINIKEK